MDTDLEARLKRAVRDAIAEYGPTEKRLWSVRSWARAHDMGPTYVYNEVKTGRLPAVQVGDRMMIMDHDGREYLANLPKLTEA